MSVAPNRRSARGFTIAELIIVMMIIVLLVAILLPALSAARTRAKKVASKAQVASLAAACESYSLAFNSAPGYISETDLGDTNNVWKQLSSSENAWVSLLGRVDATATGSILNVTYGTPTKTMRIDIDGVGSGPMTAGGRTYGSFYSPAPDQFGAVTGVGRTTSGGPAAFASDNAMADIVDKSTGMPILYFRVSSGGSKPVGLRTSDGGSLRRISNAGFTATTDLTSLDGTVYDQRNKSLLSNINVNGNDHAATDINLAWLACNPKLSGGSINNTSASVLGGSFVLISPGPDGIYLNEDQFAGSNNSITTLGELDDFDDVWITGGG